MSLDLRRFSLENLQKSSLCKWNSNPHEIGMFVAEMDYGVPAPVQELLAEIVETGATGYVGATDAGHARQAVAAWYAKHTAFDFSWQRVHLATNVLAFLRAAVLAWTRPGDTITVPTPAYPPFLAVPRQMQRQVQEVPVQTDATGLHLDLAGLEHSFAQGSRLLFLCNPANPTGRVYTAGELEALAQLCSRYQVHVFSDEIHAPITYGRTHLPFASLDYPASHAAVTAISASKGWNLAGLHCAAGILPCTDTEAYNAALDFLGADASVFGVRALTKVLQCQECAAWLADAQEIFKENYAYLRKWCERRGDVSCAPLEGTYIAWLDCSQLRRADGQRVAELDQPALYLREHAQVVLTPGAQCGEGWENHARMILATTPEIFAKALSLIDAALA